MKLQYPIFLSISALLLPINALAQDDADPMRYYQTEIILYKNIKVPKSKEYTLPNVAPQKQPHSFDLTSPDNIKTPEQEKYQVIPTSELQLIDMAEKINESERYELLLHTGWRQPGLERSQTLPIWIKAGHQYGQEFISIDNETNLTTPEEEETTHDAQKNKLYEIEGEITLALSRYLHVYVDLIMRKPRRSIELQLEATQPDSPINENLLDTKILDNYQLKEHRRMRSKTLHYLDSPQFSMLILIVPYEPSEPSQLSEIPLDPQEVPPTESAIAQ